MLWKHVLNQRSQTGPVLFSTDCLKWMGIDNQSSIYCLMWMDVDNQSSIDCLMWMGIGNLKVHHCSGSTFKSNGMVYCCFSLTAFMIITSGFIHVREMSGKFKFFQGQGIVREFCDVSGKNEILQKCQGILHFSLMKLGCLVPMYLFC